jgi:hypothetical protein
MIGRAAVAFQQSGLEKVQLPVAQGLRGDEM